MQPNVSINYDGIFYNMHVSYWNSRIFFLIPVHIFNGRKQTLVDTIGILSALRMRGLHDKRHLLAKLRIAGSENSLIDLDEEQIRTLGVFPHKMQLLIHPILY